MLNPRIAILVTTFLRDELLEITVNSILSNWQDNWILFIGDQDPTNAKLDYYEFGHPQKIAYFGLPFDCGLSFARNELVREARRMGIKYCLVAADSIQFTENTKKVNDLLSIFNDYPHIGLIGLQLNNRISWEYNLELANDGFHLYPATTVEQYSDITCKQVDVCKNFFLARTELLMEVAWDEQFKMGEHEDWFYRVKQLNKYRLLFTEHTSAEYVNYKPQNYVKYRQRLYDEYIPLLKKKYNITGWVIKH